MEKFDSKCQYGLIAPDNWYSPDRDPGSLYFYCGYPYFHSKTDFGIKKGDKVTYIYQSPRRPDSMPAAKDIRVIDNG
ncbi:MAG: hypothetical protein GY696_11460 [Gammaproteobacteria bacterium]|nr:hypothetical protein [Gammaproteobacteria bacterium]